MLRETWENTPLILDLVRIFNPYPVHLIEPQRDFQQCGILACVDSDEPVQPPFKLRNSKWCSISSLIFKEYSSDL